jgi:hypothetical protein
MTADLVELLKQLKTDAGNPTYAVMKEYADRARFDVSKSSLNNVIRRPGVKWSTVEAFVSVCVQIADKYRKPLTDAQRDLGSWKQLHEAAREGKAIPSGQLIGLLPPRTHHFLPRPAATALAGSRTGVLSGLGGVGKTQLAAAYARSRLAAGDLVIWTEASSRDSVVSGWADAGAQLAHADPDHPLKAAQRLLAWLATTSRRWLIVLDDLTDPRDLDQLRPLESAAGQIVITTRLRDTAAAGPSAPVIEVGVFTEQEAQNYLRTALPDRLADDIAGVSADLGRLPVAMGQAAAYMVDLDISCSTYRRRFADRGRRLDELFPTTDRTPGDYSRTVPVTWSLSIEAANRARPAGLARPLLELTAVLDPAGIPAPVFGTAAARNWLSHVIAPADGSDWRLVGADDIRDGLRRLHLFSLVSYDDGVVRVHELVQRAVRDEMRGDRMDDACWAAADALKAAWPPHGQHPHLTQLLRASADSLARHAGERLWDGYDYHPVLTLTGRSVGEAGRPGAAVEHFRRLHESAVRHFGTDHPSTLAALGNLAHWQGEAGDPAGGATAQQVIDGRTRALGDRHPDTLTARHTLARQHMRDTTYTAAERELETLLAQRIAILGPHHRDTLTTRHNLAACRGETDPGAAVTELESVLADTIALLGPDDPDTLSTRHELARFRSLAGDPAQAAAELTGLLADRTRILGAEDPNTLAVRSELAHATVRADRDFDPTATFAALLADQLRVLGPEHPDTLRTRLSLADARGVSAPGPEALAGLEALLDDVLRLLGPSHRLAVETSLLIGMIRDHTDLQLTVPEALLAGFQRVLGPEHPATRSQAELVDAVRGTRDDR